jgi:hypothetical protein
MGERGAALFRHAHHLRIARVRCDLRVDLAFVGGRFAGDQREVFLLHGIVLKLVGEVALGCGVLGEEQDAGRVLVEAVDDADSRVDESGRGEVELRADLLERAGGFGTAGDRGEAGRLVDGDEVGGVEEDFEGWGLGHVCWCNS